MMCRSVWKLDTPCFFSTVSARHFCLNQLPRRMILFHFISRLSGLCFMFTGKWQRLYLVCILAAVQCRSIKVCIAIFCMLEWGSETVRHCGFYFLHYLNVCYIIFMLFNIQFHQKFSSCLFFSKVDCLMAHQSVFCQYVFLCMCMHMHVHTHTHTHTQWWSCKTSCKWRALFCHFL